MKVNDMVGNCKIIARIKNLLKENKLYLSLLGGVLGGFYMADQMNYIRYDLLSQSQNNILLVGTGLGFFFAIYLGYMLEIYRKTVNEISSVFVEAKQYKSFKRRVIFAIIIWFFMIAVAVFGRLESSLIVIILFIMFFFCLLFLHKTGEKLSDIDEIVKDLFKAIVGSGKNIEKIEDLYKKIKPKAMKDKAIAINVIHYSNKYWINNETFINRLKNEISEERKEVEKNIQENKPFSFIGERLHNNVLQSLSSIIKEHYAKCGVESISEIFNIWVSVYSQTLFSKQRECHALSEFFFTIFEIFKSDIRREIKLSIAKIILSGSNRILDNLKVGLVQEMCIKMRNQLSTICDKISKELDELSDVVENNDILFIRVDIVNLRNRLNQLQV
eukprot:GHVR01104014.1.p2 GENE.GHVR01104014.1~~GHVR01104014.1.p2  ORF type:complete len:387 (+),score=32.14 GHVR01104014.1:1634-2794(+)